MALENSYRASLSTLITSDEVRLRLLETVAALDLPDCWIGAGFVRSAVWDHLHGYPMNSTWDDVDVAWFDKGQATPELDAELEERLAMTEPSVKWSVKNQARMHSRNRDSAYLSVGNAISRWPETATAVAVRMEGRALEIVSPHGLEDLFSMVVRPTPAFIGSKLPIFRDRVLAKGWLKRWPRLTVIEA